MLTPTKTAIKILKHMFRRKRVHPSSIAPESLARKTKSSFRNSVNRRSIVLGNMANEKSQVRLGVERNLFRQTSDSVPIINALSRMPFHSLLVRGGKVDSSSEDNGNDIDVVLEDSVTNMPVAIVRRNFNSDTFVIFSTRPIYPGQSPDHAFENGVRRTSLPVYQFAQVERNGKDLTVVLEGQSTPAYIIHKRKTKPHPSSQFPRSYRILKRGEQVASSNSGEGHSYAVLTIKAGADQCLMICLAAIAEEANK